HNYGLHALLHTFITSNSGAANLRAESSCQTETAGHQKSHQRQLSTPAIDDYVMTNEDGKSLRLLKPYCQRGDLPVGPERFLDVNDFCGISGFIQLQELMKVHAKCISRALPRHGQRFRHN